MLKCALRIGWVFLILNICFACQSDKTDSIDKDEIKQEKPIASNKEMEKPVKKEIKEETKPEIKVEKPEIKENPKPKPAKVESKPKTDPKPKAKPKPPVKKEVQKKSAEIKFENLTHDFGEIEEGDVFDYKFKFSNVGNDTLVINGADATCGCTTPSYPFIPLLPGDVGYIGVRYNSVGKEGYQSPKITVYTNAEPKIYNLKLVGNVLKPEKEESEELEKEQ